METLNRDDLSYLFLNQQKAILQLLMRRVQCPDTAQDLSQEAFLRLVRLDTLPHSENVSGYLFRIAERLAIDFLRHRQRQTLRVAPLDESIESPALPPEEMNILREHCELLLSAIASLPKLTRHIFLLRKIDELSYGNIAKQLNISEKTVQRHLVKAMLHCHHHLSHIDL